VPCLPSISDSVSRFSVFERRQIERHISICIDTQLAFAVRNGLVTPSGARECRKSLTSEIRSFNTQRQYEFVKRFICSPA
jgi:hypothetical protein